jgi:TRAP-type C4-dicarboxylate transport system permease small subunit
MQKWYIVRFVTYISSLGLLAVLPQAALAASSPEVTQLENFLRNLIQIGASIAGLVAAGFFVWGGYIYITSSGNPDHLDRAKRTLLYSFVGLVVVVAAFAISSFVSGQAHKAFGG